MGNLSVKRQPAECVGVGEGNRIKYKICTGTSHRGSRDIWFGSVADTTSLKKQDNGSFWLVFIYVLGAPVSKVNESFIYSHCINQGVLTFSKFVHSFAALLNVHFSELFVFYIDAVSFRGIECTLLKPFTVIFSG